MELGGIHRSSDLFRTMVNNSENTQEAAEAVSPEGIAPISPSRGRRCLSDYSFKKGAPSSVNAGDIAKAARHAKVIRHN